MINKSQIKRILGRAAELGLLIGIAITGGFLLPMYLAPTLFEALPYTTPMEAQSQQLSVSISNRNLNHSDRFRVAASNPSGSIEISAVSYPCSISDVSLLFVTAEGTRKQLPCDTPVYLPSASSHELQILTGRERVAYVPLTLIMTTDTDKGEISMVLATARTAVKQKSRLSDRAVTTLQRLPEIDP